MGNVTLLGGPFTGYTVDDLRAMTLRRLRVRDTTRYSPTGASDDWDWIDQALNSAQEDFVRKTLCLWTYAVIQLKANYRTYRLPWNFLDLIAAYYFNGALSNGYQPLEIKSLDSMNKEVSGFMTQQAATSGSPYPNTIYVERVYGNNWMFGVYPIPVGDGSVVTIDTNYGAIVEWLCPLYTFNQEYGVFVRIDTSDQYLLNTDSGVVAQIQNLDNNILLYFNRLPEKLVAPGNDIGVQGIQYPEIPREYHKALTYGAAADLLSDNPEDSVEQKRAATLQQRFIDEIKSYLNKRKKPLQAQNPRAIPAVWTWMGGMDFYNKLP
jgi:hypothetical protein